MSVIEWDRVRPLVERGAFVVWNHSGGKDSQVGLIELLAVVPREQIVVIHAALGDIEWAGALELARDQARDAGLPFIVARAKKTFLEMVEHRFLTRPDAPSWPAPGPRQCTSDLKRGPCEREIRRWLKRAGKRLVINAMGMRAEESTERANKEAFSWNEKNSKAGREWWDWLPIHHMTEVEVFAGIFAAGQRPHPAYGVSGPDMKRPCGGNNRLSCKICIMGDANDARNAAIHDPENFARYVAKERRTGYTIHATKRLAIPLQVFAGITVEQAREAHRRLPVIAS